MTRTVLRWILNVIASAGVAVTIVVGVWQFLGPPNVPAQVLAIILLTAIYLALLYAAEPRPAQMQQVALERGSAKFARYYADFYSQEGAISVFCEDTEWLEADVMKPVVEAIGGKGKKATLYLTDTSSTITDQLKTRDVNIVEVPSDLALEVKMSYRVTGTDKKLIIRGAADGTVRATRRRPTEINTFTATTNADLVNLADTIFSTIALSKRDA